ncbi:MAG: DUF4288 domain-containing protein [Methylococcaceae bacterium]|nr:DUF4288 domain-containing protein [Methylococcaceae bacterium]
MRFLLDLLVMNNVPANPELTYYIAVILYESTSNLPGYKPLYQESFVLIKGASEEDAKVKAQDYGLKEETSYLNENQQMIVWSLKKIIDVTPVLEETLSDGSEVYTRHFRNYEAYWAFEPLLGGEL